MEKCVKRKILLVEDEIIIALNYRMLLETINYSVILAHSGENAIETIAENEDIEIILMDIDLGSGLDGIETSKRILKNRELPVIFVSSHTEPEIIQKTEQITSYGYIVKDSNLTVYDASIKMAFKLYNEKIRAQNVEKILRTAMSTIPQAIFISDKDGTVVEFNDAYAAISGFSDKSECIKILEDYPALFDVYDSQGNISPLEQWAVPRALKGESAENVKYYIKRKDNNDIWIGHYSFTPVLNESKQIIGAVIIIQRATGLYPNDEILDKIRAQSL